jgi:hypothetical protein
MVVKVTRRRRLFNSSISNTCLQKDAAHGDAENVCRQTDVLRAQVGCSAVTCLDDPWRYSRYVLQASSPQGLIVDGLEVQTNSRVRVPHF